MYTFSFLNHFNTGHKLLLCLLLVFPSFFTLSAESTFKTFSDKEISLEADDFRIIGMDGGLYFGMGLTKSTTTIYGIGAGKLRIRWQIELENTKKINGNKATFVDAAYIDSNAFVLYKSQSKKGIVILKSQIDAKGNITPFEEYATIACTSVNKCELRLFQLDSTAVLRIFNSSHAKNSGKLYAQFINLSTYSVGDNIPEYDLSENYKSSYTSQENLSQSLIYAVASNRDASPSDHLISPGHKTIVLNSVDITRQKHFSRTFVPEDWDMIDINISYDETLRKIILGGVYGKKGTVGGSFTSMQGFYIVQLTDSLSNEKIIQYSLEDGLSQFASTNQGNLLDQLVYSGTLYRFQECVSVNAKKSFYIFEDDYTPSKAKMYPYFSWFKRMLILEYSSGKLVNTYFFPKSSYASNTISEQATGYYRFYNDEDFNIIFPLSYAQKKFVQYDYGLSNIDPDLMYLMNIKISENGDKKFKNLETINDDMSSFTAYGPGFGSHSPYQAIHSSRYGVLFNKITSGLCLITLVPFE